MHAVFYIAAAVAILSTLLMLTRLHAVHALLYLIVSLLALAVDFYALGAPLIAALEVIIYAGAIMVLFVFVVMMLNLGEQATEMERRWQKPGMWVGPSILSAILIAEMAYLLSRAGRASYLAAAVGPKQVAIVLFGPYVIGVELASFLLMAGLVGAYHLGRSAEEKPEMQDDAHSYGTRTASGGDLVRAGGGRAAGAP